MAAKNCAFCGKKFGMMGIRHPMKGGECICGDCAKAANLGLVETPMVEFSELRARIEKKENMTALMDSFTDGVPAILRVNKETQQWFLPTKKGKYPEIHSFDEIVDFELLEDGNSVSSGGVGRAVVGGMAFGAVGAIVGGSTGKKKSKNTCNQLEIKITLNNFKKPTEYIRFITGGEMKKDGMIYKLAAKQAQQCLSVLQVMCDSVQREAPAAQAAPQPFSVADEIEKFKDLLDMGAITQEEYDAKKKQLLGL